MFMNDKPFSIYVIEDNELFNKLLVHNLSLNMDYVVKSFYTAGEFLKHLDEEPNVVTLDYGLPDLNGKEVLSKIKAYNPEIEVIVISAQDNIETAVDLVKLGASDYIVKEKNIRERLLQVINNIHKNVHLKQRISYLEKEVQKKYNFQNFIVGNSTAILKTIDLVEKAILTNITVIITGETGTGKEVVAKAIHYNSIRKDKPFVPVNIAAIPNELIESELFGHEKGSFTGATARRIGKFEEADGGTLFLDEIGEMNVATQAKLLRALQEKEITRVGSNTAIKTNCRIIAATHRNLKNEIKEGRFREDLYYRLFGLPIELPPLRERGNDVILLARHFIKLFCEENSIKEKSLSANAHKKLIAYEFPGNIRELKSVIELAIVMCSSDEIAENDLTLSTFDIMSETTSGEPTLEEYDLRILNIYLRKYSNNIKLVAEKLNISQSTIYRMLKKL